MTRGNLPETRWRQPQGRQTPRVSVIIPVYNAAQYIVQAVESVLAQTCTDYEILVVDDGSTDNTCDVLSPYMNRIHYVWQENLERSAARNHGISRAQGELIAFLDADDVWMPHKLEQQMAALEIYPQAVLAYCPAQNIDANGRPVSLGGSMYVGEPADKVEVRSHGQGLLFACTVTAGGCTAIVRRTALEQAGPFDTRLNLGEDWEMWLRLARLGPFVCLPEVLAQRRTYGWERELHTVASDHLMAQYGYVIEKAAAADPARIPMTVRDRALAAVHVRSAVASYHLGDVARGQAMLRRAIGLDLQLAQRAQITAMLEDHARRIWRQTGDADRVLAFLERTLVNLPPGVHPPRRGAHGVLSRIYMADAFRAHGKGNGDMLRRILWPGVRNDPAWLLNRGVLAMTARSLVSLVVTRDSET